MITNVLGGKSKGSAKSNVTASQLGIWQIPNNIV
jgi:hypothetical protein